MKKTKTKKTTKAKPRVVIGNLAMNDQVASQIDWFGKPTKGYKFLKVAVGIYAGALVINWTVKTVGFGQVTFYLDDEGKVHLDDEKMGSKFVDALIKEVIKQEKKGTLEFEVSTPMEKILPKLLTMTKGTGK